MKKKLMSFLLCLCLACGMTAAVTIAVADGGNMQDSEVKYAKSGDEFLLGSWVSYYFKSREEGGAIRSTTEQTAMLADAGLNFLTYGAWVPSVGEEMKQDLLSKDWWLYLDKIMQQYDMKYTFATESSELFGYIGDNIRNDSQAAVDKAAEIVPSLMNCIGYMVKDEPSIGAMDDLGKWSLKYAEIMEGRDALINLLPVYAGNIAIGDSYEGYLEAWVNAVGAENITWLSHDFYAFHDTSTNLQIFADMEDMRKVGLKYDLMTHGFPQSCGWEGMRAPNIDEIRWNDYAYLAYGFKGLSYFNWLEWGGEGNDNGLINMYGEIENEELYDNAVALNWEIRALGDILMNLDCMHAYHTRTNISGVEYLPDGWIVEPATQSDLVLSYFTAKDGSEPYLAVFNKSFTDKVTNQKFVIEKYSGIEGLEYFNPKTKKYEEVPIQNGNFMLSLDKGEAKFLRIKGDVTLPGELTAPVISLKGGSYMGEQNVTLTAGSLGDEVYYTLDGSYPTKDAIKYEGGNIVISAGMSDCKNVMLRAIALRGNSFSELAEETYTIVNTNSGKAFSNLTEKAVFGDWTVTDNDIKGVSKARTGSSLTVDDYNAETVTAKAALDSEALVPAGQFPEAWAVSGTSLTKGLWQGFPRVLEYTFTGGGVAVNMSKCDFSAPVPVSVSVDGMPGFSVDLTTLSGDEDIVTILNLPAGEHKLTLTASGDGCTNATVKLNGFKIYSLKTNDGGSGGSEAPTEFDPVSQWITAKDAVASGAMAFLGESWTPSGNSYVYSGWTGFDRVLEYTFNGVGVQVNVEGGANMGYLNFYIDGVLQAGEYDPATFLGSKDIFSITGLSAGEHKVKVVLPGYYGVTGKTVQVNGFTTITAQKETIYKNTQDEAQKTGVVELTIKELKGEAGVSFINDEGVTYRVTLTEDGKFRIFGASLTLNKIGYIAEETVQGFNKNGANDLFIFNNAEKKSITVYVNGAVVYTTDTDRADVNSQVALYVAYGSEATFADAATYVFGVPEAIEVQHVIIDSAPSEIVMLEPFTSYEDAKSMLPGIATFILSDGSTETVRVTWSSDDYDENEPGRVRFVATVSGSFKNGNPFGVKAYSYVFLCEEVDYTYIDEQIALARSLNEEDYTIPTWAAVKEYLDIAVTLRNDKTAFTNAITVAGNQLLDKINLLENKSLDWKTLDAIIEEAKLINTDKYSAESVAAFNEALEVAQYATRTGLLTQDDITARQNALRAAMNALDEIVDATQLLSAELTMAKEAIATGKYSAESVAALQAVIDKLEGSSSFVSKSEISALRNEIGEAYNALEEKKDESKKSGCNSAVGATYANFAVILLGFAVILTVRKKCEEK